MIGNAEMVREEFEYLLHVIDGLQFGKASIELTVHDGRVVRVVRGSATSRKLEASDGRRA